MPALPELGAGLGPFLIVLELAFQGGVIVYLLLRGPSSQAVRLAWIVVILSLPLLGALLYLRLGSPSPRGILERRGRIHREVARVADGPRPPGDRIEVRYAELAKASQLALSLGGLPPCGGNRIDLFRTLGKRVEDTAGLESMIQDIHEAQQSCHVLFYIFLDDEVGTRVADALRHAAERGVRCRLLLDAIGSRSFLKSTTARRVADAGVEIAASLPVHPSAIVLRRFDNRNHRKLAVIDGQIGWTGSQNIASPSFDIKARYAPWVDLMVRIEGPAVHDLQRIFAEDWLLERHTPIDDVMTPRPTPHHDGVVLQVVPSGPGVGGGTLRELTLLAFLETDYELVITTPYFVPDEATLSAILALARSGVATRLVLPRNNDSRLVAAASRAYYDQLLAAGVEIFEFREGLLHSKTFAFDRQISVVATTNLDRRSYELNYEVNLLVANPAFTQELRDLQQSYMDRSDRIDPEVWARRSALRKLGQSAAQLLAPLL